MKGNRSSWTKTRRTCSVKGERRKSERRQTEGEREDVGDGGGRSKGVKGTGEGVGEQEKGRKRKSPGRVSRPRLQSDPHLSRSARDGGEVGRWDPEVVGFLVSLR